MLTHALLVATAIRCTDEIASFEWDMGQIKIYYGHLSDAMKAETDHVAGFSKRKAIV